MTGTGKTLVYLLPILEKLSEDPHGIFALVLSPTRELAIHINQQFQFFGSKMGLKTTLLIGGESFISQSVAMDQIPHVVVATPGKLQEIAQSNPVFTKYIRNLRFLVLDEFDRLLDPTLLYFIQPVIAKLPQEKQVILTTATFDEASMKLPEIKAKLGLSGDLVFRSVNLNREVKVVEALKQYYIFIPQLLKDYYFIHLMKEESEEMAEAFEKSVIVFFKRCRLGNQRLLPLGKGVEGLRNQVHPRSLVHQSGEKDQKPPEIQGWSSEYPADH